MRREPNAESRARADGAPCSHRCRSESLTHVPALSNAIYFSSAFSGPSKALWQFTSVLLLGLCEGPRIPKGLHPYPLTCTNSFSSSLTLSIAVPHHSFVLFVLYPPAVSSAGRKTNTHTRRCFMCETPPKDLRIHANKCESCIWSYRNVVISWS